MARANYELYWKGKMLKRGRKCTKESHTNIGERQEDKIDTSLANTCSELKSISELRKRRRRTRSLDIMLF